jgi:hypothetical protein
VPTVQLDNHQKPELTKEFGAHLRPAAARVTDECELTYGDGAQTDEYEGMIAETIAIRGFGDDYGF